MFQKHISPEDVGMDDYEGDGFSTVYGSTMIFACLLPWLNPRSLGRARCCNQRWNLEVKRIPSYVQMNNHDQICVIEACAAAIKSIVARKGFVYTSGDRHVKV